MQSKIRYTARTPVTTAKEDSWRDYPGSACPVFRSTLSGAAIIDRSALARKKKEGFYTDCKLHSGIIMEYYRVKFRQVLLTEASIFFLIAFPVFFLLFALLLFGVKNYPFDLLTMTELFDAFLVLAFSIILFASIAYWWFSAIKRAFRLGCEVVANVKDTSESIIPLIGIQYTFDYQGKTYNHSADFLSRKRTRMLANKSEVIVIFDIEKKRSFIKGAYID